MRRSLTAALPLALVLLAALPAPAGAEFGLYALGKQGSSSADGDIGRSFDLVVGGQDDSWGLGLGLRLGKFLAVQAEYQDFGAVSTLFSDVCADPETLCIQLVVPGQMDSTAVSVSLLPHLRLYRERLYLYGKLGFVSWDSEVSAVGDAGERFLQRFDGEDIVYGAGLRLIVLGPFAAFAEYERIADAFDSSSIGVTFGF